MSADAASVSNIVHPEQPLFAEAANVNHPKCSRRPLLGKAFYVIGIVQVPSNYDCVLHRRNIYRNLFCLNSGGYLKGDVTFSSETELLYIVAMTTSAADKRHKIGVPLRVFLKPGEYIPTY
ncbi:hypothetical protein TNCV_1442191 [Trichonephila clavipes]|uniref:Uncharacterized protein n=1 Tax=Trichonephila clavipes TaxID=2585209 RepID=A0A8X6RL60_TRICX|nr:hypothetical protein TNCV_1442191 [Trichonephila clavipes]